MERHRDDAKASLVIFEEHGAELRKKIKGMDLSFLHALLKAEEYKPFVIEMFKLFRIAFSKSFAHGEFIDR